MTNKEYLISMLNKQIELNNELSGKQWLTKNKTDKNKDIFWVECIEQELSELINSYPYKHWKDIDKDIDIQNAQLEIVDVMFFYLSLLKYEIKDDVINNNILSIMGNYFENTKPIIILETGDIIEIVNSVRLALRTQTTNLIAKHTNILFSTLRLMYSLGLTIETSYNIYLGKHILNSFRGKNGYKEGTYRKLWKIDDELVEDNIVMLNLLLQDVTIDELPLALDTVYNMDKDEQGVING